MEYRAYSVQHHAREPLVRFMREALEASGCRILNASDPDHAPFRITFEAPDGERMGIVAYAFNANQRETKNRPEDEHRFQVKYGSEKREGKELHDLWQDPYELYTTLLVGINTERGFFVAADPVLHSPTRFFISLEYKEEHVQAIEESGWHAWEREKRDQSGLEEPTEVLVGGKPERFLEYVRFERAAKGLSQGHRSLLADKFGDLSALRIAGLEAPEPVMGPGRLHDLAAEFELTTDEILDLIQSAPRLKMAVRGWVAERHLVEQLRALPELEQCRPLEGEGQPDVEVRFPGQGPVLIECKNILRDAYADGSYKLDFQRTRAAKGDPCSRYYSPTEFQVAAACLHPRTEQWEFRYALTRELGVHEKCPGRINNRIKVTGDWASDPLEVIRSAPQA
ncbi:hypothetical protein [Thiohalorhabdus methylotrophus]|uniref:Methylase-associated X1 domain-containing protein n=1 Tax=Thiohalorhabdus methylotrophus TaxID=3242694 RepID=A0ABV4TR12_9GAMM